MDYTEELRLFINKPRIQYRLLKKRPLWFQLCSSLDTIEDTELAIDSYLSSEFEKDGELYLAIYGLLFFY